LAVVGWFSYGGRFAKLKTLPDKGTCPGGTMSHGNDKAVGGLVSIAFHHSKALQKALTDKGDNPKEVAKFMVKYYRSMREEVSNALAEDDD
jgi:hypothetical protein